MANSSDSYQEKSSLIKRFFVETNEDKFTGFTSIISKNTIEWDWKILQDKLMRSPNACATHKLLLLIEYVHNENDDSVFFSFCYTNTDDGYPGLFNMTVYFMLDDQQKIIISDAHNPKTEYNTLYNTYGNSYQYNEYIQISIPVKDFISIANANKIEYSIRGQNGKLDGIFDYNQTMFIKGFYHSAFDQSYITDELSNFIINYKPKPKEDPNSGCYIATMAYGSYEHPQVIILREFRDKYLNKSSIGKQIIRTYYATSPSFVRIFKNNKGINKSIRLILDALIKLFN